MNHAPELSVCLPVYNAGAHLHPAIGSVLDQDYENFELIVVDDCSTEPTEDALAKFDDRRLRFVRNEQNLGLPANWNRCIELAGGEFIAIFHQDDLMLPGNLRRKVEMLRDNPSMGYVYSDIVTIDETGQTIGGHYIPQPDADLVMPGCQVFEMVAATGDPIACPAVIVRAECYRQFGLFDTRLPYATDLEMWLRIAAQRTVGFIAEPLVAHRIHQRQEGARFAGTGRDYQDVFRALSTVYSGELPAECKAHRRASYSTLARQSLPMARWKARQGELRAAVRYIQVALSSVSRAYLG